MHCVGSVAAQACSPPDPSMAQLKGEVPGLNHLALEGPQVKAALAGEQLGAGAARAGLTCFVSKRA